MFVTKCCTNYVFGSYNSREGQPKAHAPNVAHWIIRSGALHPWDDNKERL